MPLDTSDTVRVVNRSGKAITHLAWDSKTYKLEPDKDTFVPAAGAFNWFGHPQAGVNIFNTRDERGIVGFVPDRESEVRRLRLFWGNHEGAEGEFQNVPAVEMYDLDGNRVHTVIEDPRGEHVTPFTQTQSQAEKQQAIIDKQNAIIGRLLDRLGINEDDLMNPDSPQVPDGISTENPTQLPEGSMPEDEG